MADDPEIRGPADAKRINLSEEHELRYWTTKFDFTVTELRLAVRAVGPMARNVGAYIEEAKAQGVTPKGRSRAPKPFDQ